MNELSAHPKGSLVNLKVMISVFFRFFTQYSLKALRSSLLIPICRNAYLTSPRSATGLRLFLIKISCNNSCRAVPVCRQPFSDRWLLLSFAEASNTICIFVVSSGFDDSSMWYVEDPFTIRFVWSIF